MSKEKAESQFGIAKIDIYETNKAKMVLIVWSGVRLSTLPAAVLKRWKPDRLFKTMVLSKNMTGANPEQINADLDRDGFALSPFGFGIQEIC